MSLNDLVAKLSKKHEFVTLADDPDSPCVVHEWISTGVWPLDVQTGGGLPVGRIVELYGDTSTGKTLLAEQVIAAVQTIEDSIVLYIDTERAASLEMMQKVGIDVGRVIYADPDTIEEVFQLMEDVLLENTEDRLVLVVWDSIAATTVEQEKDGEYGKATVGRHALMMSQGLRKFNRLISKHNASALFVNQTRQRIGVMFGDDEATFGGKATSFYSSIRIRLKGAGKIKEGKGKEREIVGINTVAQIVKNKLAAPFGECSLPIYFGDGVDNCEACMLFLKERGVIEVRGGWHYITIGDEELKWQGIWYDVFEQYHEVIRELVLGDVAKKRIIG